MDTFNQNIGKKIRLYRKAAGMSSTQLAAALGKSKATVSKYESGAISVDIQTLCTIAQILKIELPQLLDLPKVAKANPDNIKQDQYYIYFYDGRVKRLTRNYLQITSDPTGKADATFYADLPDFTDLSACRSLYYGEGIFTDMSESFLLEISRLTEAPPVVAVETGAERVFTSPLWFRRVLAAGFTPVQKGLTK